MNTELSQTIVKRFFETFDTLKEKGIIKTEIEFTRKHDIPRRAFYNSRMNPASDRFQLAWMQRLMDDYGVSGDYLVAGKGEMLSAEVNEEAR